VADALASGHLLGYGADVMIDEPPSANNPLLAQRNAFITPHIAWATREARQRLMDVCVKNVKAFIEGHPTNAVNG
jgi:glycerate dehydrogenase